MPPTPHPPLASAECTQLYQITLSQPASNTRGDWLRRAHPVREANMLDKLLQSYFHCLFVAWQKICTFSCFILSKDIPSDNSCVF